MKKIKNFILDTLFPIHCLACGKYGEWVCAECFSKIKLLPYQICPYCEKLITEKGSLCLKCRHSKETYLSSLIAATRYKESDLDNLIHKFKYNFIVDIGQILGKLLTLSFIKFDLSLPDLIIPVPLHPRRKRWRGFNQAEILAIYVSANLAPGIVIPVFTKAISRKKYTPSQMKIGKFSERRKNMHGAFEPGEEISAIEGKKILLIDDIATTGATIFECAKVLKQNGAKKVFAAVIARQELEK